jgi:5'-3' exonuclease
MGIPKLNRYLLDNCSRHAITKKHLTACFRKTIVIDTSIYLYKFVGENALKDKMHLLISVLKKYAITPIFIFDGKPPVEKRDLLLKRRREKNEAEKKYNELKNKIDGSLSSDSDSDSNQSSNSSSSILCEMEDLKKKFVRVRDEDIVVAKEIMKLRRVQYKEAEGEADVLCAEMVIQNRAWACISDDMDLLVYGCPRIIRSINLLNHTAMFYDISSILKDLHMSMHDFREIMVISGTDYNTTQYTSFEKTMQLYKEYEKTYTIVTDSTNNSWRRSQHVNIQTHIHTHTRSENIPGFYHWLIKNTNYIKNYENLMSIYAIFDLGVHTSVE